MIWVVLTISAIAAVGSAAADFLTLYWHHQERKEREAEHRRLRRDERKLEKVAKDAKQHYRRDS